MHQKCIFCGENQGNFNEYLQHMFLWRNDNVYFFGLQKAPYLELWHFEPLLREWTSWGVCWMNQISPHIGTVWSECSWTLYPRILLAGTDWVGMQVRCTVQMTCWGVFGDNSGIIRVHHECPCRIGKSHPRGRNFNKGLGLLSPWLKFLPEGFYFPILHALGHDGFFFFLISP